MDLLSSYSIFSKVKKSTNDLLVSLDKNPETIRKTTGINNLRSFENDKKIKDLFSRLLNLAISEKNINPTNLIVCTQTPDEAMPGIASQLVYSNELTSVRSCIDINAGCTGFVDISRIAFLETLMDANNFIFCFTGDLNSRIVREEDYALSCVFGDLVNLSIFKSTGKEHKFSKFLHYEVSLKHSECIRRELNGHLQMNGMDVMTFVCDTVIPALIKYLNEIKKENLLSEFSLVLHQANKFIIEFINKKIKKNFPEISTHEFCMEDIGNSGSSTIPYAIQNYFLNNELKKKVIICGFGVGMAVSIGIINVPETVSSKDIKFIEI